MHELEMFDLLRSRFLERCFELIEKGVESGAFRMKDVAGSLGISSQVASKLVNPTSPRTLTAFELFRLSVLIRKPVMDLIPLDLYLTSDELDDADLCHVMAGLPGNTAETRLLAESYRNLPEGCGRCVLTIIQLIKDMNISRTGNSDPRMGGTLKP